jgi:hypothetical protein
MSACRKKKREKVDGSHSDTTQRRSARCRSLPRNLIKNEARGCARVRLYREALAQLREENETKAKEAELTKEAEADSAKEQDEPGSDHAQ